jgi:ribosomal protein L2
MKIKRKSYIVSPQGLKIGDIFESGKNAEIKTGNSLELKDIPPGTSIHNVELDSLVMVENLRDQLVLHYFIWL